MARNEKKQGKLSGFFVSLIPTRIPSKTVLAFYEQLRKLEKLSRKDYSVHREVNRINIKKHEEHLQTSRGYIEDQYRWQDIAFGRVTMKYAGCEVFAVFNALYDLNGHHVIPLNELISYFEKNGMVLGGLFGTSPKAILDFFKNQGYRCEFSADPEDFEELAEKNDCLILTYYNNGLDIRDQIHTIHISKSQKGYTAHNAHGKRAIGPEKSLETLIERIGKGKAKGISLIGILKK